LGQKATEYTKKLLDRLRTTEQETVFPKIKQPSAGRWLIVVAVLLLLLTGVLVFHKNIFPFVQRQYGKFFSQRTLDRVQAREMLGTIDKFIVTLKEDWNKNNEVYLTLVNNFSPEEGYPIIVETLVLQHNSSKQRIEDLESTCVRARSHLLSNPKESLDLLTPVLELSKQDSMSLLLKRIFDKLQFTHNLALQIKKTKDEEHFVFKENRNLRNDFFSAEERLSFLEEKLYLFQEEYPAQKNYLGVSPEFNKKLLESKRKIDIAKQSIHALNEAMIENNVPKAKGILQENSKFSSVLDDLDNLEHQLTTLTDSNAKKKANWELQSTYSRGSSYLDTIAQQLQERLVFAKTVRREHAKRKQGLQDPVDLWGRVDIEISRIKEEREKLNNFWAQSKSQEVLAFSQEILKQTEPLVLNDLQKFIENEQEAVKKIEDDLRIKKAASKKQSVQQQQRIADFLSKLRSQYQIVVNAKIQWNKAIEQFQKEFPDKIHTIKNTTLQNELKKLDEWQNKTLQDIENYLNNKQIREAYNIASRQNAKILQLPKYSDSLTKEINKIQVTTKNLLQEKENLALQARCERIVQRLETNISLMENQVYPLEKDIQALRYDFQPRSQYPEISKKSLDMVEDSRNWIRHYQSKLQIARNYMQNKQWHDAFEVLKGFEGVRLSGYTTLSSNIQTIQEEIAQTRRKSEQIQLHIARSGEYTKFHQELLQLKNDLSQVITDLRMKKEQLDRFSASEGYQVADPNIPKYLNEGLEEIKELEVVLAKGNEYLESQKYAQATALLKPYSQELHPGTSRILLLKTYLQQCDTKIQKNISLQQDSGARHSILQEQAKKQQELALLQQWRKSPASWYDQMIGDLQQFTSWESLLVKSMQGKGSTMVHSRIQSLIADISSYPDAMAELQDLENKARNIGINQTELARDYRNKAMLDYLHTHQIDPGLASEVSQIQSAVRNIKKELNSYWVEEATLRSLLQALQSLERKFENQHQSIKSRLLVLITN
ncbi:MAG TPA: hypothetical protein PLR86_05225, partial [Planctomycetota bacterium]|nr:hypothetical protein [Planctomycetota bacterium]